MATSFILILFMVLLSLAENKNTNKIITLANPHTLIQAPNLPQQYSITKTQVYPQSQLKTRKMVTSDYFVKQLLNNKPSSDINIKQANRQQNLRSNPVNSKKLGFDGQFKIDYEQKNSKDIDFKAQKSYKVYNINQQLVIGGGVRNQPLEQTGEKVNKNDEIGNILETQTKKLEQEEDQEKKEYEKNKKEYFKQSELRKATEGSDTLPVMDASAMMQIIIQQAKTQAKLYPDNPFQPKMPSNTKSNGNEQDKKKTNLQIQQQIRRKNHQKGKQSSNIVLYIILFVFTGIIVLLSTIFDKKKKKLVPSKPREDQTQHLGNQS